MRFCAGFIVYAVIMLAMQSMLFLSVVKKSAVTFFGWVFFFISSGSPHVRCTPMPMGRTCEKPDEIVLTPMGVNCTARQVLIWVSNKERTDYQDTDEGLRKEEDERNVIILIVVAVIVCVLTTALFCIVAAMRKRIRAAVALIKYSAQSLTAQPATFVVPVVMLVLNAAWVVFWAFIMLNVVTCTDEEMDDDHHIEYNRNRNMELAFVYMLLALYWISQFFVACEEYIIATVVTRYYLLRNNKDMNLTTAVARLFSYNLGSVALGSFLVATIQFVRYDVWKSAVLFSGGYFFMISLGGQASHVLRPTWGTRAESQTKSN